MASPIVLTNDQVTLMRYLAEKPGADLVNACLTTGASYVEMLGLRSSGIIETTTIDADGQKSVTAALTARGKATLLYLPVHRG